MPLCGRTAKHGSGSSRQGGRGMAKKDDIVRYTAEEIDAMIAAGESRTDWSRNDSYEEIEAQIASDPDLAVPDNWEELARPGFPFPLPSRANKRQVTVRYDAE